MARVLVLANRSAINPVHLRIAAAVLATALLGACASDSPTGTVTPPATATPGWLTLQVSTPRTDDGAVQFAISGPGVDSARIVGYDGLASVASSGADLVVTGNISNGTVAQIHVPDVSHAADYHATVVAAAARDTYALQDLTGYRALIVR